MGQAKIEAIRRLVKKNQKYKRFKEAFEGNPNYAINFNNLHDELARMHTTRKVRSLHRKSKGFTEDVVDSMLQDQAVRSRCTEILGICVKIAGTMEDTLTNLRDYLLVEFSDHLKTVGTQAERKAFTISVLRPFYKYLNQIDQLREHCKLLIDDVDKAGFTYRNLVETIKILTQPERVSL